MDYQISSEYQPMGDQPAAIAALVEGVRSGAAAQVLLGVTGSGKTFTIANVIAQCGKPALVLSHNKTLAAQLYAEMKGFFPENAVEYYVSYYDYYQPEAYIPSTDTYIEKDLAINEDIDRLRLRATAALLSGRRDVVVVSSVSCIYGMGNPAAFYENVIELRRGMQLDQGALLRRLVDGTYQRNDVAPRKGCFRVKGDTIDVFLAYAEEALRISFWGDEVESISLIDADTGAHIEDYEDYKIYPANLFLTSKETQEAAIRKIQDDLTLRVIELEEDGRTLEAKRLQERVQYDIEMIRELGHCSGIENYSRYFDGREAGTRPYCLLDFFPKGDFLVIVDESHVSVPQIRAMYGGDRARKTSLVEYGFRLPAAFDNRPLRFDEWHEMVPQVIYISATPAEYELQEAEGVVVEQLIRPTGLLDPVIEVRGTDFPVDDLLEEIHQVRHAGNRVLVTTISKRMAEELAEYLQQQGVATAYIHSDVDTLERVQIMQDLRRGVYDVLVGVNLLREGLDLPEVSLVAILDADKEGFLRDERSLTQTAGRAARNVNGRVIMYAKSITPSMQRTIDETERRRMRQLAYNAAHHITPRQIVKSLEQEGMNLLRKTREALPPSLLAQQSPLQSLTPQATSPKPYAPSDATSRRAAEAEALHESPAERRARLEREMYEAAAALDFIRAAQLRDQLLNGTFE